MSSLRSQSPDENPNSPRGDGAHDVFLFRRAASAFGSGAVIGTLGGLLGLGGAEFRLPLLLTLFKFRALEAVILNKAMSLIVVATALPFRAATVPLSTVFDSWPIILNLLAGSLVGAWFGAGWAMRLSSRGLYRIISIMLVLIAGALLFGHGGDATAALLTGVWQLAAGLAAGFAIGIVASVLGVAGGELLIPTLVLLFGADVKLAGSLSLAISLPTMIVGFARYSRDRSCDVLAANKNFVAVMAAGSIVGTIIGGQMLGLVPDHVLLPALTVILLISAWKVWQHV